MTSRPTDGPETHVLILDAQSLAGRAAHVTAATDTTDGIRLWCQMVRGVILDVNATHVIAAWDHAGKTFRHEVFDGYKRRRTGSMRERILPIRLGVEATGMMSVSVERFEGDDVVASLMHTFRGSARVTLISNDSDLLQLVSPGVEVATYVGAGKGPRGMRVRPWPAEDVVTRLGVPPEDVAMLKAITGEDGDDIPGVKGVARGTALKLYKRWGSFAKAIEATSFVSHRDDTAKLAGQEAWIATMLELTTIRQDVPVPQFALAQCEVGRITWPEGSHARGPQAAAVAGPVQRATGPGLEDVPWPDEVPPWQR